MEEMLLEVAYVAPEVDNKGNLTKMVCTSAN